MKTTLDADIQENKVAQESVKSQILAATKELQEELTRLEKQAESLKAKRKSIIRELMLDKNVHVLDRFQAWLLSNDKVTSDWIYPDGKVRDYFFCDIERYRRIDVVDIAVDEFCWKVRELDFYNGEMTDEQRKAFDESDYCPLYTDLMEELIENNISEFEMDW